MSEDIEDIGKILAAKHERCSCKTCADECSVISGCYDPEAIYNMIELDKTTIKELAPTVALCKTIRGGHWYLRPRSVREKAYSMINSRIRIIGDNPCINLGPEGCKLSRDMMPYNCIATYTCRKSNGRMPFKLWRTDRAKKLIELFMEEFKAQADVHT